MDFYSKEFRDKHANRDKILAVADALQDKINEINTLLKPLHEDLWELRKVSFFEGKFPIYEGQDYLILIDKGGSYICRVDYRRNPQTGKISIEFKNAKTGKCGVINTKLKYSDVLAREVALRLLVDGKYEKYQI